MFTSIYQQAVAIESLLEGQTVEGRQSCHPTSCSVWWWLQIGLESDGLTFFHIFSSVWICVQTFSLSNQVLIWKACSVGSISRKIFWKTPERFSVSRDSSDKKKLFIWSLQKSSVCWQRNANPHSHAVETVEKCASITSCQPTGSLQTEQEVVEQFILLVKTQKD